MFGSSGETPKSGAQTSATNGTGDDDQPYRFGRRPTVRSPFPFTEREFARLLIARSRVQAAPSADDFMDARWLPSSTTVPPGFYR